MESNEKTLDSGAHLLVTMAPFEVSHKLLKVVTAEIATVKFAMDIEVGDVEKLRDIFKSAEAIETIKNIVMRMISSDAIEAALWDCMAYATYDKVKILKTNNVFDSARSRGDFLVVAKEVLWFNLSPFFQNLGSALSALGPKSTASPR